MNASWILQAGQLTRLGITNRQVSTNNSKLDLHRPIVFVVKDRACALCLGVCLKGSPSRSLVNLKKKHVSASNSFSNQYLNPVY
jgi:hypothetical protein